MTNKWTARTVLYSILFLLLVHLLIPVLIPLREVYHNRLNYNILVNRHSAIDPALERIKREIERRHLDRYVIVLGDSVFYGSPGSSDQNLNAYWIQDGMLPGSPPAAVFNLSLPAAQMGDLYVLLLKLERLHISTEHLILNVRYGTFVSRLYGEKILFWWKDDLAKLDPEAYRHVSGLEEEEEEDAPSSLIARIRGSGRGLTDGVRSRVLERYNLFDYKEYLQATFSHAWMRANGKALPTDALSEPVPWYEKDADVLKEYLESDQIAASFSEEPMELENSPDVYFLKKITERRPGSGTCIVLTGTNRELMKDWVAKPGYRINLERLSSFLSGLNVQFLNLDGRISDRLFTDHTHLMPEGYREMAKLVMDSYKEKGGLSP